MTPLPTGQAGREASAVTRVAEPEFFGSSSRLWGRRNYRYRYEDPDDYEDADEVDQGLRATGTYRTLCVRLCDGYYFPISFSATRIRFERDANVCEKSCPDQARLFVQSNPGGEVDDMVDLRGQPYRELSTAFLYRAEYVPACRCKPNPWDAEARQQHRVYALEAATRKGDKQARAELAQLPDKMKREGSGRTEQAGLPATRSPSPPNVADTSVADPRRSTELNDTREKTGPDARTPRERPSPSWWRAPDWLARAFGRY